MTDRDILKEISKVDSVPTLPTSVTRVLAALDDEDASANDVAELVSYDAAMTGQILKVANSVFHNASGLSTTSVGEAVIRIGMASVRNLVVSQGVVDTFRGTGTPFPYSEFLTHSFGTAIAAGAVARLSPTLPGGCARRDNPFFLAGLLHDVGTLLLCQHLGEEYALLIQRSLEEETPFEEVEREELGTDHQEAGGALIRRWGLPLEVAAAAEFHHRVSDAPPESLDYVQVAHLADWIATESGLGAPTDKTPLHRSDVVLTDLGIDDSGLGQVSEGMDDVRDEAGMLVSAALSAPRSRAL